MFLSEKFEQIQNNTDYTLEEKIKAFLEAIADSIRNEKIEIANICFTNKT